MSDAFPALVQLGQAYLHQDFKLVSGTAAQAVEDFLAGEPRYRRLVADEIDRALASHATEGAARAFVLEDMDSNYLVEADGLTYRGWLQSIADRARAMGFGPP